MPTTVQPQVYEQKLIKIVRRLPPERVSQVVDFASFLEFQGTKGVDDLLFDESENEEQIRASEEKWDKLFAKPEAKRVMRTLAQEALSEYRAGRTTDIAITSDGRLKPA